MTRDDIIRMAEESTPDHMIGGCEFDYAQLEHFAKLVAAAEREAIAQMIEDSPPLVSFAQNEMGGCLTCGFTPKLAALTIRERGSHD